MTLDKIDLIDRKFAKSLLGYSRSDVDRLVAEAAESIGRLAEEKMALARTVEDLRREVAGYQGRETTLRDTMLTTQTIVEDLKAKAQREAEALIDEARDQAAGLIRQAEEQAGALAAEIDALTQRKAVLTARFRDLLLSTLDILDADAAEDGPALVAASCGATGPDDSGPEAERALAAVPGDDDPVGEGEGNLAADDEDEESRP